MVPTLLLVAEDDPLLSDVLEEGLKDAGFELLMVANGTAALEALESDTTRFKGIVTDIKLGPGPDGWEVAHQGRALGAHLAVVYTTGDSAEAWAANGVPNSIMIPKPYAVAQVIAAVAQLLNISG
jgi:DNA-binding response OmpR family regulator